MDTTTERIPSKEVEWGSLYMCWMDLLSKERAVTPERFQL